jgi:CheY-like chemotaxis protein
MEIPPLPRTPLVLVVDDHEPIRRLYGRVLTDAGLDVCEAADGFNAMAVARREGPAVILLDGDLPVFDGFEVCRWLKGQDDTCSIPIVFVTGMSAPSYRDAALEAGADVFVTKPVTPYVLLSHVRSALNGS